MRPTK
ncbi:hypothetical protein QTG54_008182 [Skeletonema marinoi]